MPRVLKWSRRKFLTTVLSFFPLAAQAGSFTMVQVQKTAGPPTGWQTMKIGGGGYMIGMSMHSDGTIFANVDVNGAYIGSTTPGASWSKSTTATALPSGYSNNHPYANCGVISTTIDPSNSNNLWQFLGVESRSISTVLKSTNKGGTWTTTGFANTSDNPNDGNRFACGQKMAVDPANSNVLYVGTAGNGLFVTTNGGTSFSSVAGGFLNPTAGGGVCGVLFDSTSGTTGGKTNRILAGSNGRGIYVSADAGATWTLISGSPTSIGHAKLGIDGTAYFTDLAETKVWRITTSNVVTDITPAGSPNGVGSIATDPFSADKLVAASMDGSLSVSTNCRAATPTWTSFNTNVVPPGTQHSLFAASTPLWLSNSADRFWSLGEIYMDPTVANRCWMASGTGMEYTDNVYALSGPSTSQTWVPQDLGIENLQTNTIICPPGGPPIGVAWDRPFWTFTNPDSYAANYGPYYTTGLTNPVIFGACVAYSSTDPTFIVGLISLASDTNWGKSTDGGRTWSAWGGSVGFTALGGAIAASDPNHIVIAEAGGYVRVTANGGGTWGTPTSGLPNNGGYGPGYFDNHFPLTVDRVDATTFYLYNNVTPGLYISTDGGANWSLQHSGRIAGTNDNFCAKLESVPGKSGHLCFTEGNTNDLVNYTSLVTLAASVPAGTLFKRSTDHGANWTTVPNVNDVITFGFGMAKPGGGGYPAVFIVGWVSNVYGIWRSDDFDQATPTWTNIGTFPMDQVDLPTCITGDMSTYNRCYAGFHGSGFKYFQG